MNYFEDISKRIGPTILFDFIMFSMLLYTFMSDSSTNPIVIYVIWFSLIFIVYANEADWIEFTQVAGIREEYFGFNVIHGVIGIGVVGLFFGLITSQLQAVYTGNQFMMSLIKPLYSPLDLTAFKISLDFDFLSKLIFVIWVGATETLYLFLSTKNTTNWLIDKGVDYRNALITAFFYRNIVWAILHFFARGGINILSVVFAIAHSILFWAPYLITYYSGLVDQDDRYLFRNVNIVGVVMAHSFWDLLIVTGIFGNTVVFNIVCALLIPLGLFTMRVVDRYTSDKVLLEVQK